MYFIQHCFVCRPSDFSVSEGGGIEPRTIASLALAVRRSNHSVRSHLHLDYLLYFSVSSAKDYRCGIS